MSEQGQTVETIEELPFHEAIVEEIKTATLGELVAYCRLCTRTKIPAGHDAIKDAIQARFAEIRPNLQLTYVMEALDRKKEAAAAEKSRKAAEADAKAAVKQPVEA